MRTWMRWGTCALGVGLTLVPMTGRAQEAEESEESEVAPEARRTLLLALPLSGSVGQVGASVEHAVGSRVTLVGEAQVSAYANGNEYVTPGSANFFNRRLGAGVAPGVHFYLSGRAPEGFWVGTHFELATYHESTRSHVYAMPDGALITQEGGTRTVSYGGSARLGYTAVLPMGLTVQVGVGVAALASDYTPFIPRTSPGTTTGGLGTGLPLSSSHIRSWSVAPRMTVGLGWAF